MDTFIEKKRPPENIRHKIDLFYKTEGQSIIISELRPGWDTPKEIPECSLAKTTYVKAGNYGKIFWFRAGLKWHGYSPKPTVKELRPYVT